MEVLLSVSVSLDRPRVWTMICCINPLVFFLVLEHDPQRWIGHLSSSTQTSAMLKHALLSRGLRRKGNDRVPEQQVHQSGESVFLPRGDMTLHLLADMVASASDREARIEVQMKMQ